LTCLDAALRYAARGWPVLPLVGKIPLFGTHGVSDATLDELEIRRMFRRPGLNVGIAAALMLIVDVDTYKESGAEWLARYADRLRRITLTQQTGRDGYHFCFELPGGELRGKICDGVDLRRGAGQYIVAEPSRHPETGKVYRWLPGPAVPQPIPAWLLEQCRPVVPAWRAIEPRRVDSAELYERARLYVSRCDPAVAGCQGHNRTLRTACRLIENFPELCREDFLSLLDEYNARCVPPWKPKELEHKLDSAFRKVGMVAA